MISSNFIPYKSLVFDCDGVLLNSNKIKTNAFYQAALPYGEAAAQALVDYHIQHGGVSRYRKFEHFIKHIVPYERKEPHLEQLLDSYAKEVRAGLLDCEVAEDLSELRHATGNMKWFVVSGGDQSELRDIFKIRDLHTLFDGGIYGSPSTKYEIVINELAAGNLLKPALVLGDSQLDYDVAMNFALDFVFIFNWTELRDWKTYVSDNDIRSFSDVKNALATLLPMTG